MNLSTLHQPKNKKINKLFLIGNGFDLALGLPTRYEDFIKWFLKKEIRAAFESDITAPPQAYRKRVDASSQGYITKIDGFSDNELFDVIIDMPHQSLDSIFKKESKGSLIKFYNQHNIKIIPKNKGGIFQVIIDNLDLHWIDIEGVYFKLVKQILRSTKKASIVALNNEMSAFKKYFIEYLSKKIKIDLTSQQKEPYLKQFNEIVKKSDLTDFKEKDKIQVSNNYFLNFNYTNSLSKVVNTYIGTNSISKSLINYTPNHINHIHGSLNASLENIIFGFGDEMDKVYAELEELNDNLYLEHIKSFQYFKSPKYRELLRFLNSSDFQVCIYGHSCGLSDRVMLNEIFEHKNCKSIKIYYYDEEDFNTKTMEISRHFNDNQLMRKKIVEFDSKCKIPQVK